MKSYMRYIKIGSVMGASFAATVLLIFSITFVFAQELATFKTAQVVSAADMNANFSNIKAGIESNKTNIENNTTNVTALTVETALKPPVGSIVAWHKSFTGVPSPPAGWMECDGSTVMDVDSPLNGQALPDLNGQTRFLRGSATSGTLQNATKVLSIAEIGITNEIFVGKNAATAIFPEDVDAWVDEGTTGRRVVATSPPGLNPHRMDAYRVRSINMSVVWIMRVK